MDKIQCKGADNNEHCHRQQFHSSIFFKIGFLVRKHQIGNLYDVCPALTKLILADKD